MTNKKRQDDILEHKHLHNVGLFTFFIFIVLVGFFNATPNLFAEPYNRFNIFNNMSFDNFNRRLIQSSISELNSENQNEKDYSSLENTFVQAKSFIVYDVKNKKVLAGKNQDEILPLASLTKIVAAITASKLASPDTDITIRKDYMKKDEIIDIGMKVGQKWKMNELLKYALTISSNSSIDIIANTVSSSNQNFVDEMNKYTKELGFKNFYFNSASGLDYGDVIGGNGTAFEYAQLFAKAYELIPNIMSYTINSKVNLNSGDKKLYQVPNTNEDASSIIGLMASKTGYTDLAGGNLAILVNLEVDRPVVIVVLGSTVSGRFDDVNRLHNATEKIFRSK
ncbi:MAG: serine hydrolase [Candidatus Nomurabacteria bacterium]